MLLGCKFAYHLSTRGYINEAVKQHPARQALGIVFWFLVGACGVVAGLFNSAVFAGLAFVNLLLSVAAFKAAEC